VNRELKLGIALSFFFYLCSCYCKQKRQQAHARGLMRLMVAPRERPLANNVVICNGFLSPGPNAPLLPANCSHVTADDGGTFTGTSTVMIGGGPPVTQWSKARRPQGRLHRTITYDQKFVTPQVRNRSPLDIHLHCLERRRTESTASPPTPATVFSCELRRVSRAE